MGGHVDARKRSIRSSAAACATERLALLIGKTIAATSVLGRECFSLFCAAASHAPRYAWLQFIFVSTLGVTAIATGRALSRFKVRAAAQ
jgi:hypothetical protein